MAKTPADFALDVPEVKEDLSDEGDVNSLGFPLGQEDNGIWNSSGSHLRIAGVFSRLLLLVDYWFAAQMLKLMDELVNDVLPVPPTESPPERVVAGSEGGSGHSKAPCSVNKVMGPVAPVSAMRTEQLLNVQEQSTSWRWEIVAGCSCWAVNAGIRLSGSPKRFVSGKEIAVLPPLPHLLNGVPPPVGLAWPIVHGPLMADAIAQPALLKEELNVGGPELTET